jgi:hypothetical protein
MLFPLTKSRFSRRGQRRLIFSGFAALAGLVCTQAALASNITVASPVNGSTDTSPLWVRAHNVGCNSLAPTAFGYSIDNSATTTMGVTAYDIDVTKVGIASGSHTIHFKAWTTAGICPVVSSTIKVAGGTSTATPSSGSSSSGSSSGSGSVLPSIPFNAVASLDLDTSGGWSGEHDTGTPGSSKGSMLYPATTPLYDDAREFYMTYSGRGGERWHDSFANDASATHFVMDTYVYVTNPSQLANLELDLNQVMSNGKTVIFGTQCSTYSHTWEYTYYSGSFHWRSSNVACDPLTWAANTWHHIQVAFHRDSSGNVTHDWVIFDGKQSSFSGTTVPSAQSLGWAKGTLLMNIQMDGYSKSSGSITAYFHKTTYYRW